jgi:tetratricopeptide (TPR) repeat protein
MSSRETRFTGTPRFELVRVLGEGGMGVVYEAIDHERDGRVALKTIRLPTADGLARFKKEFRALQDLQHPNLVRLDELLEHQGTWFFTMELVDGVDFIAHVRPGDPPRPRRSRDEPLSAPPGVPSTASMDTRTVQVVPAPAAPPVTAPVAPATRVAPGFDEARLRRGLHQLALALSVIHDAGKVHRDVKPGNILVTADGRVVLLDFGLITDAYLIDRDPRAIGTLGFMAPEQIAGRAVGPAADWYAVGVTLYQALTGRRPFLGTADEIIELKQHVDPLPPRALAFGIPADLDRLCVDLVARDPARRPTGPEIVHRFTGGERGGRPRRPSAAFVGRDGELAALSAAWRDARDRRGVTVLVHGESGIGKSALVRHFIERLVGGGAVVLAGRCYEREAVPYKALDEVMEALGQHLATLPGAELSALLPERIALVASAFPTLRQVPVIDDEIAAGAETRGAEPVQTRVAMFAALRELWTRLCARGPLVVAIDDLQWADADSLALLAALTRPPAAPHFLLAATVRTAHGAGVGALRDHLGDDVRELLVDRLEPAAAHALAAHLLADDAASGAALAVADEAAGHPMFIEALVGHRASHAGRGPLRLDDALRARTDGLGRDAARLLDVVCVAGGPVRHEICAAAVGSALHELAPAVTALRAARLIKTEGVKRADAIEPYHDRVRESVVAALTADARRDVHGRLAAALEAGGDGDAEALAVHLGEAGKEQRAGHYAAIAAERAQAALAFERAARLYRTALELDPGEGERRFRLRLGLAEALACAGRGEDAAAAYVAAAPDASPAQQLELGWRAAEQLLLSGRFDEGTRQMTRVLAAIGMTMPATTRGSFLSLLAHRLRLRLRGPGLGIRLRDPASIPAAELTRIDVCWSMAVGMSVIDPIRGADFQARHLLLALRAGDPYRIACGLAAEASFSAADGGAAVARTERLVAAAEELAARVGHPNALGYAAFARAFTGYVVGRWRESRELFDRAEALFRHRCAGVTWWIDTTQYLAMESLFYGGEIAELCRRVPAVLADAQARGDLYAATHMQLGIPHMYWLFRDDVAGARRHAQRGMAGWSAAGFHVQHESHQLAEVQTLLYTGDGAGAYQRLREVWPALRGSAIFTVELARINGHHERARAALAAAAELPASSRARRALVDDARRSVRRIAARPVAWGRALASLDTAAVLDVDGDRAGAIATLDAAIAALDGAGMALYATVARRRRAILDGNGDGVRAATAWMREQGIVRPDRVAAMLLPGAAAETP